MYSSKPNLVSLPFNAMLIGRGDSPTLERARPWLRSPPGEMVPRLQPAGSDKCHWPDEFSPYTQKAGVRYHLPATLKVAHIPILTKPMPSRTHYPAMMA